MKWKDKRRMKIVECCNMSEKTSKTPRSIWRTRIIRTLPTVSEYRWKFVCQRQFTPYNEDIINSNNSYSVIGHIDAQVLIQKFQFSCTYEQKHLESIKSSCRSRLFFMPTVRGATRNQIFKSLTANLCDFNKNIRAIDNCWMQTASVMSKPVRFKDFAKNLTESNANFVNRIENLAIFTASCV